MSHAKLKNGSLTDLMREQCKFHILWRKLRRQSGSMPLESTRSYGDARQEDKNDLRCANAEFENEIAAYERWRDGYLNPVPGDTDPPTWGQASRQAKDIAPRPPGFNNQRDEEWMEITRFWEVEPLPEGMERFFDDYVHDSRAAFKLTGPGAEEMKDYLESLVRLMVDYELNTYGDNRSDPLTPDERKWAKSYMATGRVPEMESDGREPASAGAGYLRFRKIYAGSDDQLISRRPRYRPGTRIAAHGREPARKAA